MWVGGQTGKQADREACMQQADITYDFSGVILTPPMQLYISVVVEIYMWDTFLFIVYISVLTTIIHSYLPGNLSCEHQVNSSHRCWGTSMSSKTDNQTNRVTGTDEWKGRQLCVGPVTSSLWPDKYGCLWFPWFYFHRLSATLIFNLRRVCCTCVHFVPHLACFYCSVFVPLCVLQYRYVPG